jgi:hypothetical protein
MLQRSFVMNTRTRMGLIVGFLMIAGIAIFACAERGTSESNEEMGLKKKGRSEKRARRGHRKQPDDSPGSPMEQDKGSQERSAGKGQAIETP